MKKLALAFTTHKENRGGHILELEEILKNGFTTLQLRAGALETKQLKSFGMELVKWYHR